MRLAPRLTCNLLCTSGFAGVCLSHHSIDPIYTLHLIALVSTLWFSFVGKIRSYSKAPSHVKYAKKVEASNFVLQWCAVMWYGHHVIVIIFDVCNDPCCNMTTGRSLMVVFNSVKTCVSIHLVIALFQVVVIVASDDGQPWSGATDLDAMLVMMEIMSVLWRWRSKA